MMFFFPDENYPEYHAAFKKVPLWLQDRNKCTVTALYYWPRKKKKKHRIWRILFLTCTNAPEKTLITTNTPWIAPSNKKDLHKLSYYLYVWMRLKRFVHACVCVLERRPLCAWWFRLRQPSVWLGAHQSTTQPNYVYISRWPSLTKPSLFELALVDTNMWALIMRSKTFH